MVKKILVAEDERALARVLKLKLEKSGFEVFNAFNGEEALKILKTQKKIDLILLDLVMPKMDGFGFLEEISKMKKKIKVVITSNLSQDNDVKKAKALGAIDFLVKSNTSISDIVDKVKKIIG